MRRRLAIGLAQRGPRGTIRGTRQRQRGWRRGRRLECGEGRVWPSGDGGGNNTNGLRGNERIVRKTVSCDSAEGWVGADGGEWGTIRGMAKECRGGDQGGGAMHTLQTAMVWVGHHQGPGEGRGH
jgi:hypothetical protein